MLVTRKIVNKTHVMTIRDRQSLETLTSLGIEKPSIKLTCDSVFSLKPDFTNKVLTKMKEIDELFGKEKKKLIVSIRNWKNSVTMPQNDFNMAFAEKLDRIIDTYDINVLFLPMRMESDIKEIRKVMALMKNESYIFDEDYSEKETMAIIGKCDMTIAMRLHTLIN